MNPPREEYFVKEEQIEYLDEVKEEFDLESRQIVFKNETAKCGEVMIGCQGNFTFICALCTQHFLDLNSFGSHIKDLHLNQNALSIVAIEKADNSCDQPDEVLCKERSSPSIPTHHESKPHSPHPMPSIGSDPIRKKLEITPLDAVASSDFNLNEGSSHGLSSCEGNNPATTLSDSGQIDNYICTLCGSNYLARSSYMRHMKRRHPELVAEQKICKYCDKEFEDMEQLETHICARKGRMRYVCPHCPKVFHSRENRREHITVHAIQRPFKCLHCPKTFSDPKYLEKHKRAYHERHNTTSDVRQNALTTISSEKDDNRDPLGAEDSTTSVSPQRDDKPESQSLESTSALNTIHNELETAVEDNVASSDNINDSSKNDIARYEGNSPVAIFLNSTKTEEFVCTFCGCSYNAKSSLVRHIQSKHPEHAPVQKICKYCDKEFDDSAELNEHVRTHTGIKRYLCPLCPKVFECRSSRQDHINTHTGERPFKCTLCPLAFKQRSNLENHKRKCHKKIDNKVSPKDEVPVAKFLNCAKVGEFGCGYCGHSYRARSSYRRHMKTFHPNIKEEDWVCIENYGDNWEESNPGASITDSMKVGEFACEICGRSYQASSSYKRHMKIAHPEGKEGTELAPGQLKCKYCYEQFTDRIQYTTHVLAHTEQKRYKCPFCPKVFAGKNGRQYHINTHTGERPHKCSLCPKAFAHVTNLEKHKRAHLKIKNYACSYCGKRFVQSVEKKVHERTHTGEKPYQCEECGDRFICKSFLTEHCRKHKNIKSVVCKICGKAFISKRRLRGHSIVHKNERPYHCNVCGKSFPRRETLRTHKLLHSGVKKYVCNICGAAFAQCAGLHSHRKTHGDKI